MLHKWLLHYIVIKRFIAYVISYFIMLNLANYAPSYFLKKYSHRDVLDVFL